MAKMVSDSFDESSPEVTRVGAHRGPARRGRGWLKFGIMLASFAVLVGAGQFAISQWGASLVPSFDDAKPQYPEVAKPEYVIPVVDAVQDPKMPVTVLNGTPTSGFASVVGNFLVTKNYHVIARANASSHDLSETVIYYNHLSAEAAARAIASSLGVERVELATSYQGSPITVVVGSDYKLPA
ncbi:MAG: LytR C-terminal domain-containing protein [Microbacteriaceae bacterium]